MRSLAAGHGFSAVAPNYGQVPSDIDAILNGACPMVASFGGRDRTLKGAAARLEGALEQHQIDHDVKEYPDAGHSFLVDHKGLVGVLGVVMGARSRCARPHPDILRAPSRWRGAVEAFIRQLRSAE